VKTLTLLNKNSQRSRKTQRHSPEIPREAPQRSRKHPRKKYKSGLRPEVYLKDQIKSEGKQLNKMGT
jgi:hypothetical protein